jgi:glycosyltransferase involved in cell wall biosynthesis
VRALLTAHRLPPDGNAGVERYTLALARELSMAGDDVVLFARRQGGSGFPLLHRERTREGLTVFRVVGGQVSPDRFLTDAQRLNRLFSAALVESAPEVVHVNHLWGLDPGLVGVAHRYRAAVVISLHDFYFACPLVHLQKRNGEVCGGPGGGNECARTCFSTGGESAHARWGLRAAYFRRLLASAHRVICYSEYVADYFERLGLARTRVRVIPNGAVESLRPLLTSSDHRRTGPDSPLRVAFVGTIVRHKGVHHLVEALRFARLGSVELSLVGHAPDEEYLSAILRDAGALPGVTVRAHGPYEPASLPEVLAHVDCVVVPSLVAEAGPIVPRESLALGLPTIVSDAGALPEAVRHGINGLVFPAGRPRVLAELLQRLAWDISLLPRLREGALETPLLTTARHAGLVRDIYEEALSEAQEAAVPTVDIEELESLHGALSLMGFATDPQARTGRTARLAAARAGGQ